MTTLVSAKKPQLALTLILIVLSLLLAACGDSTATPASQTTAPTVAGTTASSATTTSAATTAAGTTATTAAASTAASTTAAASAAATTAASSGAPVKLTVFAPQDPTIDYATNAYTKELSQKLNIDFTWQTTTLDGGPAKEKRQISLASGDFPDLYMLIPWVDQFTPTDLLKYSKQGVIIPLNDLINQYAPNLKAALANFPELKAMSTAPDGNIYGIPQWIECFHCEYQAKLWINTSWLKKLGLEQPKTTEDLKNVLTAFKTKDPNGNGKADEIPLSGDVRDTIVPYLMNAFIYDPQGTSGNNNSTLVLNNGKVDNNANKDGWKQGLAYIKSLYDAGLIDQGAFTQNPDALKKEGDNAEAVILGSGAVLHPATFVTLGQADGRDKQYDAVPPLTGPGGIQYAEFQPSSAPGATFVLTSKASKEAQIAAIKMLDLNYTPDGQSRSFYGIEGQDWRKPQAGDVPTEPSAPGVAAQINLKSGEKPHNAGWGAVAQYFMPKSYFDGFISSTDLYSPDGYLRRLNEATKLYAGKEPQNQIFPYWGIWIDPSVASEYATLQTNIENYIQQNTLQFITGSKSLDKDWDSYVKGLDQLGLPRYLELNQQAYDASSYKK